MTEYAKSPIRATEPARKRGYQVAMDLTTEELAAVSGSTCARSWSTGCGGRCTEDDDCSKN